MAERNERNAQGSSASRARHRRHIPQRPLQKLVAVSGVTLASLVYVALWPAAPYLRHIGVPVPHAHLPSPLPWLIVLVVIIYVGVEVYLLAKAVASVGDAEVHARFRALMLTWPYTLVAPYVFTMTRALPNRLFIGGEEEKPEPEPEPEPPTAEPEATTMTVEQWRRAFTLLMNQYKSIHMDRDLQDVIIRELRSLEEVAEG